jgi:tagatose-1,6-bisphosphate aldolase
MTDITGGADSGQGGSTDDIGSSGYSLSALADYLDGGRSPRIAAIESNPECLAALAQLERLKVLAADILETDASAEAVDDDWMRSLVDAIGLETRAGRDIPLTAGDDSLVITEGALREAIRAAGDDIPGVLIGRSTFRGDIAAGDGAASVHLTISVVPDRPIRDYVDELRAAVAAAILRHTNVTLSAVDITVTDVHQHPRRGDRS